MDTIQPEQLPEDVAQDAQRLIDIYNELNESTPVEIDMIAKYADDFVRFTLTRIFTVEEDLWAFDRLEYVVQHHSVDGYETLMNFDVNDIPTDEDERKDILYTVSLIQQHLKDAARRSVDSGLHSIADLITCEGDDRVREIVSQYASENELLVKAVQKVIEDSISPQSKEIMINFLQAKIEGTINFMLGKPPSFSEEG